VKTSDFDYFLPREMIAQTPIEPRDRSRMMVVNRASGMIEHRHFFEITDYLREGDVLVCNNSRVINARLSAVWLDSGGKIEIFLLNRLRPGVWEALVRSGRKVKPGMRARVLSLRPAEGEQEAGVEAEVTEIKEQGVRVISFSDDSGLAALGAVPLPPYIHEPLADPERYQTVYARVEGSVAAPTAGLHFTPELMECIREKGVQFQFVCLHTGLATFRPVQEEDPRQHQIKREYGVVNQETAAALSTARAEGRHIICVGTTSVRLVEAASQNTIPEVISPFEGWVDLYILTGYRFRMTDAMITNFHLPRSTLLMLVSAFAGKELIDRAYQLAIAEKYRFYSFGDAMLIL
jgi:S-adenosylmethionine:tRNA ribosyltransferase-isomerase